MWSGRLIWIFGALFIVFGLPLAIIDGIAARNVLGGLSTLSLGGFAFALAYNATATGTIRLQYSTISRSAQPRAFWAAVSLVAVAGLGVVTSAIWLLFFKN
jgi:hypothetical protein